MWRNLKVRSLVCIGKDTTIRDEVDGLANGRIPEDILDHGDTGEVWKRGIDVVASLSPLLYLSEKFRPVNDSTGESGLFIELVSEQKFGFDIRHHARRFPCGSSLLEQTSYQTRVFRHSTVSEPEFMSHCLD